MARKRLGRRTCWTMSSVDYINAAVKNIEETLKNKVWKLPKKAATPMLANYVPELDASPELEPDDIQYYQELIGMLRWATELGRVDVLHEVALLSQYQAAPRQGYIDQVFHI